MRSDTLNFFKDFVIRQDEYFFVPTNNNSDTTNKYLITQKDFSEHNIYNKSIFVNHSLKPVNLNPLKKEQNNESVLGLPIILAVFIFATIVKYLYGKRLNMITKAFTGSRYVNQLMREGNIFNERITLPLFIIFLLNTSVFLWLSASHFALELNIFNNKYLFFLSIISLILIYYFLQITGAGFWGYLFKAKHLAYQIKIIIQIFNMALGLILLPLIPFLIFSPQKILFFISIILIIIILVWKILRIIHINFNEPKFSQFYLFLFLYLCSVEIIPMIIVIKFLSSVL